MAHGYGRVSYEGRMEYAHRLLYQLLVGPIPKGLQIDHLCRRRDCVNPQHLEVVSATENVRRADNHNREKTHCPQGHPFDEINTYRYPDGRRQCHTCRREHRRRWKAKQRR
jgi:hypothetical protein